MTYKLYFILSVFCLVAVIATQCSNSPSRATNTSPAIPVSARPGPQVTDITAEAETQPASAEVGGQVERADIEAAARSGDRARPTATAETESDAEGLAMRRLIVARGVDDREPVGADSRFRTDEERIYAFMEMVNNSDEDRQVVVTFERDDGAEVGHITVNVPANAPRWRTWAWSRHINTPGTWTAVITTPDGTELGRERFQVEG